METRSTLDETVALVRYQPIENSLARAFDLSEGLQGVLKETQDKGLSSISKTAQILGRL